jgi:hypothetical protein
MNLNPKELRAQAKQLLELARTIEMSQNPQAYLEKQVKRKVSGMKTKMKNEAVKSLLGTKK